MAALSASRGFGSDPLWQRAQAYLVRGQLGAARQVLTAFQCAGRGSGVHAYLLAAQLALFDDRVRDAARLALGAAQVASDDVEARCAVAGLLLETGETVAARDCLDRVSPADCRDALPLLHASALRKQLHQHVEALALLDRAKSLGDTSPMLRVMRGASLIANGRLNEAEAEFAAALTVAPAGGRRCSWCACASRRRSAITWRRSDGLRAWRGRGPKTWPRSNSRATRRSKTSGASMRPGRC